MDAEVQMNRREFLEIAFAVTASAALPSWAFAGTNRLSVAPRSSGSADAAKDKVGGRRNVVFVLCDDLGYMDIGANNPKTFYETPNIDRLAAQGMRFTDGYAACSVCSPTRASIMTGKYPARLHLTDFIGGTRQGKLKPAPYIDHLPLEEVTIAEALKEAGYATGFFGKWHLGGAGYYPEQQGFDVNMGGCAYGLPPSYFSPYKNPTLTDGPDGEYLTDRLTDEAIKFIEINKDNPFFVYLSHYAVHNPQQAKAELIEKYKAKAARLPHSAGPEFLPEGKSQARQVQDQPVYAAMIQSVDEGIGRITKRLHELGLDKNTVVIFTSDNGGLSTSEGSPTSNVPLRAGKGWLYEGGIREPMIVRAPGVTKKGSVCKTPVMSTDYYPTLLELAGLPLRPKQHVDGVNLVPALKGKNLPQRPLFWHYPHYSNQGGGPGGAVRLGDFKLIEWFEDGRVELYNVKNDIAESNDLSATMPEKASELVKMLRDWRKSVDAAMPTPNPDYTSGSQEKK